ncbi:RDD family protein [Mesonia sp. K7]|uniref:RDD family protein n=1 Tax=Mesonia sp. K7 TaxID=2218606 RepID=UPI000DA8B70D|nr:RDD family protein [Mesonia sp. K7]PZD77307.1 RDD family protein [Mesonia sp. K7]
MDNYQIQTAQNIEITQNVASIWDRILAYLIDGLVLFAYIVILSYSIEALDLNFSSEWTYVLIVGLVPFLYHLLFETFNNGQSLGKMALKIRVVKLDGTKPAFSNFLIRWMLRMIDITFTSGAMAVFALLLNGKGQRLGDLAAKTTVISEKEHIDLKETLYSEMPTDYVPSYSQASLLSDEEVQQIKRIYNQAKSKQNHKIILELSRKVEEMLQISAKERPMQFIEVVLSDYQYYSEK